MKISLVLATIGRTAELEVCLKSLAAQTDHAFEVLVVDQNCDDRLLPVVEAARESGLTVNHLRLDHPGLSRARNLGLVHAIGEVIGFPDDDCWYEPDAVAAVRRAFAAEDGLQGAVGCWVEQSNARGPLAPTGSLRNKDWRNFRGGDASSISLFLRKELIDQLGGFDPRFGVGHWYGAAEETDLILRALARGARLIHCPSARVHHHYSTTAQGSSASVCAAVRRRARGTGGLYAKHELQPWTVLRGLAAPVVIPFITLRWPALVRGVFVSLGRLEGFLRWTLQER